MSWKNWLARRRSRFWHEKTALDLLTDASEQGSLAMARFVLSSRLSGEGASNADPRPPAASSAPRTPRILPEEPKAERMPGLIFQTWKVRCPLPANYRYWSATLSTQNPTHQHIIWDDADNRDFIACDFPWFLPCYDRYPGEIYRVDMVRLFFLYRFGGLYVDMDTECLRPVGEALGAGDVILGSMGPDKICAYSIPNAVMGAKPRQLFWLLTIANAMERAAHCRKPVDFIARGPEYLTGAVLLRDSLRQFEGEGAQAVRQKVARRLPSAAAVSEAAAGSVAVLPPTTWYPINWNNLWHQRFRRELLRRRTLLTPAQVRALFPDAHMVSYWTHSW